MSEIPRSTTYLVTGGNRGIGLGLVKALLAQPWNTVIATARNVNDLHDALSNVTKGEGTDLHVFSLDLNDIPTPEALLERFNTETKHSIQHIDVLISNAGQATSMGNALDTTPEQMRFHFQINTIAPLVLVQAFMPLLKRGLTPKIILVSSSVGSIEAQEPLSGGAYGPSKAALNWIARRLHFELEPAGVVSVALHPGWVQTENGRFAAASWNYDDGPPMTVEESVNGVLDVVNRATRENFSGKFVSYDGSIIPW